MAQRPYNIIVWGATGFTGKLVCEHLARDYQGQGVRWAMAARSKARVEQVQKDLVQYDKQITAIPILVADAHNQAQVDEVVRQADVVIAMAGPYAQYGTPIVDACVRHGTHYCDITGEVPWIRRNIAKYHDQAKAKGVKIVHCCGFDSVPSDMGSLLLATHAREQHSKKLEAVEGLVGDTKGGFSGGTVASLVGAVFGETAEEKQLQTQPYCLNPPGQQSGPDKADNWGVGRSATEGGYTMPFVMQAINTRIVRRSNALYDFAYGRNFSYTEALATSGAVAAYIGSAVMALGYFALLFPPTRWGLMKVLPQQGAGPSKKMQVEGFWNMKVVGRTEGPQPRKITAQLSGNRDPGYWQTSRFILEAGLCLALDEKKSRAAGCLPGGVLTPATACGMPFIDRLNNAGSSFKVTSDVAL